MLCVLAVTHFCVYVTDNGPKADKRPPARPGTHLRLGTMERSLAGSIRAQVHMGV